MIVNRSVKNYIGKSVKINLDINKVKHDFCTTQNYFSCDSAKIQILL